MGLYKIEGIVLRRRNLGEADRLVTVLSRDRGKLTVVARGSRRPRSRLGGRLEPATRFRALIAERRSLDVISQVEVLDAFAALRVDLERMGLASIVLEYADRALADRHPQPEVYRLLVRTLALVRRGVRDLAAVWFVARLLQLTGHRPATDACAVCGKPLRAEVWWSAALGGCLDEACRVRDPRAAPMTRGARALLRFLLDAPQAAVQRAHPGPPHGDELAGALRRYAEACWEMRLRAPDVLWRLRRT